VSLFFGDKGSFAFELRPLSGPPPEGDPSAAATWAELLIWLSGKNVTQHLHLGREQHFCDGLHWPVVYLARWLVRSWHMLFEEQVWPIPGSFRNARDVCHKLDRHLLELEEAAERGGVEEADIERFAEQRDAFVRTHALAAGSAGGLVPDMYFARDGARVSIALRAPKSHTSVQFLYKRREKDIPVPLFVDAAQGLVSWTLERVREIDDPVCAQDREVLSAWLTRLATQAAAEAGLFGYIGVNPSALKWMFNVDRIQPITDLGRDHLTELFELDPSWATAGARFDPSRSGVAMVFRALAPTLTPADIFDIVRKLREYPRSVRADDALRAAAARLPPRTGRENDFEYGYHLAEAFRAQINNRSEYFDVEAWLRDAGIAVEEMEIPDPTVDGGAVWDDAHGPVVIVNSASPRASTTWGRRMVLAHEFCHLLIDREAAISLKIISGPWAPPVLERRANAFAAELLLPREGIVKRIGIPGVLPDDEVLEDLMKTYEVGRIVCVEHVQNRFDLRYWPDYRPVPLAPRHAAQSVPPVQQRLPTGLKEFLLSMPDVGDDADFERPMDHGRQDEPWDS
jgi:Zn-dependent peptidase ImmA (M78 family)